MGKSSLEKLYVLEVYSPLNVCSETEQSLYLNCTDERHSDITLLYSTLYSHTHAHSSSWACERVKYAVMIYIEYLLLLMHQALSGPSLSSVYSTSIIHMYVKYDTYVVMYL